MQSDSARLYDANDHEKNRMDKTGTANIASTPKDQHTEHAEQQFMKQVVVMMAYP